MRILFSNLEDAKGKLAASLRRRFPPRITVCTTTCWRCSRIYGRQFIPYDPDRGSQVNEEGMCLPCTADLLVNDLAPPNTSTPAKSAG